MNSPQVFPVPGIQASGIPDGTLPPTAHCLCRPSLCPLLAVRQVAWPGAVLHCLSGQGLASRLGQEAGALPFPGKMRSLGILPCWRNWFLGPASQPHLREGSLGLGTWILSVTRSSLLFCSFGKSQRYLCISWPFTKLIKP